MIDYIKTIKEDIKKVDSEIGELLKKTTDLQDKRNKLNIQLNDEIYENIKLNVWYKVAPADDDTQYYFLPLRKNDGDVIGTLFRIENVCNDDTWITIQYDFCYFDLPDFKEIIPNEVVDDLISKYTKKIYGKDRETIE
jgi:hypothetical protein